MELLIPARADERAEDRAEGAGRPAGLRRAVQALDRAAHDVRGDRAAWRASVTACLERLEAAWTRHAASNERPGGFFDQLRSEAPQLDPRLRQLHREHDVLHGTIRSSLDRLRAGRHADTGEVCRDIDHLLGRLVRHEQRGADVIHQAYEVDVGGGD